MEKLEISESVIMFLLGISLISVAWFSRIFLKNIPRNKPYYLIVKVVISILFPVAVSMIILTLHKL